MSQDIAHINRAKKVLNFINQQKEQKRIGLLYNKYTEEWGEFCFSYKTFYRIIEELEERELIIVKKIIGGSYGSTRIITKKQSEVIKWNKNTI